MAKQKLKLGDVCEIETPAGLGYVQYVHDRPKYGQLVRVLPGLYASRPDLKQLAQQKELYYAFYILDYAVRDKEAFVITNEPVPEWAKAFPKLRHLAWIDKKKKTVLWYIMEPSDDLTLEGIKKIKKVTELTPEQKKLSLDTLWPHPVMVKKLAQAWLPGHEDELIRKVMAESEAEKTPEPVVESKAEYIDHYLYFPKKSHAEEAAKRLRTKGWWAEVRRGADGENWLALAKQPAPVEDEIDDIRDQMEKLASELGGEYDGWGAAV